MLGFLVLETEIMTAHFTRTAATGLIGPGLISKLTWVMTPNPFPVHDVA